MSIDTTFKPIGLLTFVGTTPIKVAQADGSGLVSYRVRNLAAVVQSFSWGPTNGVTAQAIPSAQPGVPNTVDMLPSSIETFEIPAGVFFVASSATGFTFLPGQGQ